MAHPSFPWQDEALSVALHKPQVYIDLSGWSPKYFPPLLVQYANTLLKDKVLFGSDYPGDHAGPLAGGLREARHRPEVRPLILKENAARLFGLTEGLRWRPPTRTSPRCWRSSADVMADKPAIAHRDRTLTWKEYDERSARLAEHLADRGIGQGSRVCIALYNGLEYMEAVSR